MTMAGGRQEKRPQSGLKSYVFNQLSRSYSIIMSKHLNTGRSIGVDYSVTYW